MGKMQGKGLFILLVFCAHGYKKFLRAGAKVICCAVVVNNAIAGGHFAVLRPLPTFNGLQLFLRPAPVLLNALGP